MAERTAPPPPPPAADAAEERRAWQRALLDESPLAVAMAEGGLTTYGNAGYLQLFGFDRLDELLGRPLLEQIAPESRAAMQARMERRQRGEAVPPSIEVVGLRRDGSRFLDRITSKTLLLPTGPAVFAFHEDITERRQAEESLRVREERLRTLAANLPVFLMELSTDGTVQFINRVLPHLTVEQVLGRSWLAFIPPAYQDRAAQVFKQVLETGVAQAFETLGEGPGAKPSWYLTRLSPMLREGSLAGVTLITEDISERQAAQAALQASEARYRALIEAAPVPIGIHRGGVPTYGNAAFLSLHRMRSLDEIGASGLLALVAPESRPMVLERVRLRAAGLPTDQEYEYVGLRADGTTFPCALHVVPVELEDGPATLVFHHDLTNARRAMEAREQAERQLHQTQKMEALGTLSGGIAHDFNNLLSVVLVDAEVLLDRLPEGDERRELAEEILASSLRARDLVQRILTFARRQEPARRPARLEAVAAEALKLLHATIAPNVAIELEAAPGAPAALIDATQLHQVLTNLATNAAHAMGAAGGRLRVEVCAARITPEESAARPELRPGHYARLTIRDTGSGMSPATQKRIFEPFFTTKPLGQGTGLGLAIVHGIVASHEGFITVESSPGVGSAFHLYFPAHEAPVAVSAPPEDPMPAVAVALHVLLVDDEELVLRASGRMLTKKGLTVTPFSSPKAALAAFTASPAAFDAALIDLSMPEMSGLELAARLTAVRAGFPVLLASGNASALGPEQARAAGIREIVGKPYDAKTLLEAVERATRPADPAGLTPRGA